MLLLDPMDSRQPQAQPHKVLEQSKLMEATEHKLEGTAPRMDGLSCTDIFHKLSCPSSDASEPEKALLERSNATKKRNRKGTEKKTKRVFCESQAVCRLTRGF